MFSRDNCSIKVGDDDKTELTNTNNETMSAYKFAEKLIDLGDFLSKGYQGNSFLRIKENERFSLKISLSSQKLFVHFLKNGMVWRMTTKDTENDILI